MPYNRALRALLFIFMARTVLPAQAFDPSAANDYLSELTIQRDFSGAVLIADHGRMIFSKGYGFANQALATPNTPQTVFLIASVTKQFTAMAILL